MLVSIYKRKLLILKLQFIRLEHADRYLRNLRIYHGIALVMVAICMLSSPVYARPELGPPSIKLRTNVSNIVIAELDAIGTDSKLTFKIERNLHNEAQGSILIRSDALTSAQLSVGQSYIIAYVGWDVKRFPRVVKPRRDGAVIISLNGATPAIFQPNPDVIKLLQWDLDESLQSPDAMLELILRGMAETDPQLQNFFVTELVTRPKLYNKLAPKQKQTVISYLENSSYTPAGRNLMLGNPAFSDFLLSHDSKLEIARQILTYQPVQIDFGSQYGGLVRTAMKVMEGSRDVNDAYLSQRWLSSNQPVLVESAAAVIYAVNPETVINSLEQVKQYSLLEKNSRDTITRLLIRYRRSLAGKL